MYAIYAYITFVTDNFYSVGFLKTTIFDGVIIVCKCSSFFFPLDGELLKDRTQFTTSSFFPQHLGTQKESNKCKLLIGKINKSLTFAIKLFG